MGPNLGCRGTQLAGFLAVAAGFRWVGFLSRKVGLRRQSLRIGSPTWVRWYPTCWFFGGGRLVFGGVGFLQSEGWAPPPGSWVGSQLALIGSPTWVWWYPTCWFFGGGRLVFGGLGSSSRKVGPRRLPGDRRPCVDLQPGLRWYPTCWFFGGGRLVFGGLGSCSRKVGHRRLAGDR